MHGEKKFMTLEEFMNFCTQTGQVNDNVNMRQAIMCFHLSMMTQVDEINFKNHMHASFLEFLEAWARLTDIQDSDDPEKDLFKVYTVKDPPLDEKLEEALIEFASFKNQRRGRKQITAIR